MNVARRLSLVAALVTAVMLVGTATSASPSVASPLTRLCSGIGLVSGAAGKLCTFLKNGRRIITAGGKLARGHVGAAVKALTGASAAPDATALGLAAVATWAAHGATFALGETAKVVAATVRPRLAAPWFSKVYWRVAGIAALLTIPFLFAAAIQALLHADLWLLARAAFGYLPLAMVAVGIAAQLTALLLTAIDGLSGLVSSAAGDAAPGFLTKAGAAIGAVSLLGRSPFLVFLLAVFTVAGAIALWTEMMMREAAVYVIVVMLPLAFAAMVWPARRVWALRAVEVLAALILSKLAIVTVLTLGGVALESVTVAGFMAGPVLLLLAIFAPWAMLRLVPMAELASGAAGRLRAEITAGQSAGSLGFGIVHSAHAWASATTAHMRREAQQGAGETAGAFPALEAGRGNRLSHGDAPGGGDGGDPGEGRPGDGGGTPDGNEDPVADAAGCPDGDAPTADGRGGAEIADESAAWVADSARPWMASGAASPDAAGPVGGADNPGFLGGSPGGPASEGDAELDDGLESSPADDGSSGHYTWTLRLGPDEPPPERPWPGAERLDQGGGEPTPPTEDPDGGDL